MDIAITILGWMLTHEDHKLIEEASNIMEGLEKLWQEEGIDSGIPEQVICDAIEILTTVIVARNIENGQIWDSDDEQYESENENESEDENETPEVIDISDESMEVAKDPVKLNRADNMRRVREEKTKLQRKRKTVTNRELQDDEIPIIEVVTKKQRLAKTMQGRRLLKASEVSNRLVQDRAVNIAIVGADVESLYPSLEAIQVADIIYKAIMETDVAFKGVNYQEGCRYIALTSSEQECRLGPLRDTGTGPAGAEVGDQEQWEFRKVELTTLEKRLIVAKVMHTAVLTLFQTHTYTFGGKYYLQKCGGPIGLRSTCAIARIVMIWWDQQFLDLCAKSNLILEDKQRYMDDIRVWCTEVRLEVGGG